MSLSLFERRQRRGAFFSAGQNAFLIGVTRENNPYKEQPFRDTWEKGWRSAKEKYRTVNRFYAEVKLAALLGTTPPTRPAFTPRPAQRPVQRTFAPRPSLQQKFTRSRSHGAFKVGQ